MPASATNHLEIIIRIAAHTPDNRRHFLAALSLHAVDKIGTTFLVEEGVFTVMPRPHATTRRIDQLMGPAHNSARRQLGQSVFPTGQDIGAKRRAPRRWSDLV